MKKNVKSVICILLLITLSISTAFLAYLQFFARNDRNLSGEWVAELDMTDRAAVAALGWLQDVEGVSVSLEDVEAHVRDLKVRVYLMLEQTARSRGTFRCGVLPESYEACRQAAYEAFAAVFREVLAERLRMVDYGGGTDEDAIEALVVETFGMSTVSYLMSCGPELLPSLEELQAQCDGSGTYETAEGILSVQGMEDIGGTDAMKEARYIRQGDSLILSAASETELSGVRYPVSPWVRFPISPLVRYPAVYVLQRDDNP